MDEMDIDDDDDAVIVLVPYHDQLLVPSQQRVEDSDDGQDYYSSDVSHFAISQDDGNCWEPQDDSDGDGRAYVAAVVPLYASVEDHTDSSLQLVIVADILAGSRSDVVVDHDAADGTLHGDVAVVEVAVLVHQLVVVAEAP